MDYRGNGKLLISGEYLVLIGAKALALPTRFGQTLKVSKGADEINWRTTIRGEEVFSCRFNLDGRVIQTNQHDTSLYLEGIFSAIVKQKGPDFLRESAPLSFESNIEFPADWGLGSSSSLISNLALWSDCNPFMLLTDTIGGSGYDIACSRSDNPLLYRLNKDKPEWDEIEFAPGFMDKLHFVHLNRKENSREAVQYFEKIKDSVQDYTKERISNISEELITCTSIEGFSELIMEHEAIMADILNKSTAKAILFPDYPYAVKSLGAWGGDFVLAVGDSDYMDYFMELGYNTIIPYSEMIKTKDKVSGAHSE